MTDVRSLLRDERASRRIEHPHAVYSTTGTLECTVCHIPIKSGDEIWSKHLKSTQHAMRAERLRLTHKAPLIRVEAPAAVREINSSSKKRKASEDDDESRKRSKPVVALPSSFGDGDSEDNINADTSSRSDDMPPPARPIAKPRKEEAVVRERTLETIDEAEWAAFERDVATPPPPLNPVSSALMVQATISAAPISAADQAAQDKEEQRLSGKETRELELEAEKEDAARALEDELDEMESLEERVRRLREKREELRLRSQSWEDPDMSTKTRQGEVHRSGNPSAVAGGESEDEYSDEGWVFGR